MTPETWTEVLIERARLRGYISGWKSATRRGLGESRIRAGRALYRISRLRQCEACHDGWMDSAGYPGYRHPCQICHGSGIAPEGDDK
jgi:hypothetical protein